MNRTPGRPPGAVPVYKTIAQSLAARFESGEFPVGRPVPSCRQLARTFSVGPKTIWLALKELKREGRIELEPGRAAVATRRVPLASVLEGAVAVVIKIDVASLAGIGFRPGMGHGILKSLSETRTTFIVLQHMRWWRHEAPQGLRDVPIKGILIPGPFPTALLKEYESIGVPTVLIDQPPGDAKVHSITVENYQSAFDATTRLLELGHRRIAFVRSVISNIKNIDPDSKERQEGFLAAFKKARIKDAHHQIFSATFGRNSAAIDELLSTTPPFTAVMSSGEAHATQIFDAAKSAGIHIPRDLSVVTFRDSQPHSPDWSGPMIDFEQMGRVATELLQSRPRSLQHVRFKTAWHEGTTIAPPRK
jgi:DNA-binding LacI/PurR family transcriptional regulator